MLGDKILFVARAEVVETKVGPAVGSTVNPRVSFWAHLTLTLLRFGTIGCGRLAPEPAKTIKPSDSIK